MTNFWHRVADIYDRVFVSRSWLAAQVAMAQGVSGRVLEVCCGTGNLLQALLDRGIDAYGVDLAPAMVRRAAAKLRRRGHDAHRVLQADARQLPFGKATFDFVLATGCLGLMPPATQRQVLAEMARVCRRELRLLEPFAPTQASLLQRAKTWCIDGMRPLSGQLLTDMGLTYTVHWHAVAGIFACVSVPLPPA